MAWKNKTPKQPKVRGPKDVQPMNKKTKSVLVWTTTGVVLAGVTVGITVPLVLASQKETELHAFKPEMANNELFDVLGTKMTGAEFQALLDKNGLADASLLNELTYQSSFFLYDKEERGSLDYQMMQLKWEQYNKALGTGLGEAGDVQLTTEQLNGPNAIPVDELHEIAKIRKQLVAEFNATYTTDNSAYVSGNKFKTKDNGGTQIKEGVEPKDTDAKYQTTSTVQADKDKLKEQFNADKAKYNDLNNQLESQKNLFNKTVDRITKLQVTIDNRNNNTNNSGGINYDDKNFSSDYPQVLLPMDKIREKQQKIFNEAKDGVVGSYPTREEGLLEWSKQISDKYNGATNEQEAVDYLVNTQVSTSAFTRFEFAINSDYTYEQYQSGIFAPILGTPVADATSTNVTAAKANGVGIKEDSELSDKVYFFGTRSKEVKNVNALLPGNDVSGYITKITNDLKLISINNAIFPVKQGTTSDAPWTITKEDLIKLFSTIGTNNDLAITLWDNVFTSTAPSGWTADERDKQLIAWGSGTTDGTQWKTGDLGMMPTFSYINGMTNGWAAGVTAIMSSWEPTGVGAAIRNVPDDQDSIYQNPTALKDLVDVIVIEFYNLALQKNRLGVTQALTGADNAAKAADAINKMNEDSSTWNLDVKDFINSLTDEETSRTFGAAIRNYFNNLAAEAGVNPGTGIPVAIEIEPLDFSVTGRVESGIYMTFTEEFGIHVMKINSGFSGIVNQIKDDLVKAADKQSTEDITTDYAKILTEKLTQARKLQLIMGDGDHTASATNEFYQFLAKQIADDKLNIDVDKIDEADKNDNVDEIWDKAKELIDSIIKSAEITEVNSAPASTLSSWLMTRIDNRLSVNPNIGTHTSMTPDEIYNDFVKIGGIN